MKRIKLIRCFVYVSVLVSVVVNIILGAIFLSKKPFEVHRRTGIEEHYINGVRPAYSFSEIDHPQYAAHFAQDVWKEKYGSKGTNPYSHVSGDKLDVFYLKNLDCWAVTTSQKVGLWKLSPYALFDPEGKNVLVFLSPFKLFR